MIYQKPVLPSQLCCWCVCCPCILLDILDNYLKTRKKPVPFLEFRWEFKKGTVQLASEKALSPYFLEKVSITSFDIYGIYQIRVNISPLLTEHFYSSNLGKKENTHFIINFSELILTLDITLQPYFQPVKTGKFQIFCSQVSTKLKYQTI